MTAPLHLSGTPRVNVRMAASKAAANLSVWLVALPFTPSVTCTSTTINTSHVITRGWADPQNRGALTGGAPLVPGEFVDVAFNLQPTDKVVLAGQRLALMVFSSDRLFTLRPQPGTEVTVDLAGTSVAIPVVGGSKAFTTATGGDEEEAPVGGTVPATLSLTLGAPATFGAFTPGVAKEYTTASTANVISTAGDAALTVSDPGHLTNGAFSLPQPLQVGVLEVGLVWPDVQRAGGHHVQAGDRSQRRAAHRQLQQDPDVHALDHESVDAVGGPPGSPGGLREQRERAAAEHEPGRGSRRGPDVVVLAAGAVDLQRRRRRSEGNPAIGAAIELGDRAGQARLGQAHRRRAFHPQHVGAVRRERAIADERLHGRAGPVDTAAVHAFAEDRERCLRAGMDDYLGKPIRREDLDPVLERWLGAPVAVIDGVVDSGRADRLNRTSPGMHERLMEVFARTTPPLLEALRAAVERGEDDARRKLAHRLRGSSDAVGARRLSALAWQLEHGDDAEAAVAELEPVHRETLEQFQPDARSKVR